MRGTWSLDYRTGWRMVGWLPAAGSAILLLLAFLGVRQLGLPIEVSGLLEALLPLGVALHATFLFSPDDEAPLEIMLACPRPMAYLVVERAATVAALQGGIGLIATLLIAIMDKEASGGMLLLRWLVPSIVLAATAVLVAVGSRQGTVSVVILLVLWFVWLVQGDAIVARWPFLQPVHPFLSRASVSWQAYLLNRLCLVAVALFFGWRTLRLLDDDARLLGFSSGKAPSPRGNADPAGTPV